MNEEEIVISSEVREAVACHQRILESGKLAASALVEMGKGLKLMRDKKLYKTLGYDTFSDYVENNGDYKFKERQAYSYIKAVESFSEEFLTEHSDLGITKLSLLSALSEQDAVEVIESSELSGMNADEVKALVREKQALGEQLSFWKEEAKNAKDDSADAEMELKTLQEKIEQIEGEKRRAAVEAEKAAEQLRKAKEKHKNELAKLNAEIEMIKTEQSSKPTEEQRKAIADEYEKRIEDIKAEYEEKARAAEAEKQALADKLKRGDPDEVRAVLRAYFIETQKTVKTFIEKVESTADPESRSRFITGTIRWLENVIEDLGET